MSGHAGSTLDAFLDELGELEEVNLRAQKKVVAAALRRRMEQLHIGKAKLARRMSTSRTLVDRLLDPGNTSVTLATLARASAVLGLELHVRLRPVSPRAG